MPFSVKSVAFISDNIQEHVVSFFVGIDFSTISGFDHDVSAFISIGVSVGVLVSAVVGDVLSDFHAVESHKSESNFISIVFDFS